MSRWAPSLLAIWAPLTCAATPVSPMPGVPLCPGLTIVTAVAQPSGDYESIKTVESIDGGQIRLRYSSEMPNTDPFDAGPPLKKLTIHRNVRLTDLETAVVYEQTFLEKSAELIPGTTAIGVSAAVLISLRKRAPTALSISNAYPGLTLSADPNQYPNFYSYLQKGILTRTDAAPARFAVLLNDIPVELPVLRATANFAGDADEFEFLDDERNPLTLGFRMGIGAIKPLDPNWLTICDSARKSGTPAGSLPGGGRCDHPNGGDRDVLRVIKINHACPQAAAPGAADAGQITALEQALAGSRKVDIYSIYFSFNSDAIREESAPTLNAIAEVLRRHPDWKLAISGHTDAIGSDSYNLDLSRRRAAAVGSALTTKFAIAAGRLATSGFGRSQPKDTNDTLEGRARNRRVELVRL